MFCFFHSVDHGTFPPDPFSLLVLVIIENFFGNKNRPCCFSRKTTFSTGAVPVVSLLVLFLYTLSGSGQTVPLCFWYNYLPISPFFAVFL